MRAGGGLPLSHSLLVCLSGRPARTPLTSTSASACSPAGARLDDQEAFNAVLEPWAPPADVWTRGRRDPDGKPWPPSEFGPAHLRVALFDPFLVPSGCRLPEVLRRGLRPAVVHANCNQGLRKLVVLAAAGQLLVAPWGDADIAWAAVALALLGGGVSLARALLRRSRLSKHGVAAVPGSKVACWRWGGRGAQKQSD